MVLNHLNMCDKTAKQKCLGLGVEGLRYRLQLIYHKLQNTRGLILDRHGQTTRTS